MDKGSEIWSYIPLWGNWYVERAAGEGGFGRVFRLYRDSGGRRMYSAVKWIKVDGGTPEENKARCAQAEMEIHSLYDLRNCRQIVSYEDHLAICRANGSGYDVFIRMAWVEPLKDWIEINGLNLLGLLTLGRDVSTAMKACYDCKVVHGDIKLGNLFVTREGIFQLGDFGIATRSSGAAGSVSLRAGSADYCAPEVMLGSRMSMLSDQFSLGRCLERLMSEKWGSAEACLSARETLKKLRRLLSVCLAVHPKDRFQLLDGLIQSFEELRTEVASSEEVLWLWPPPEATFKDVRDTAPSFRPRLSRGYAAIRAFWSPYAAGKTTLACNGAYALSKYGLKKRTATRKVALLDLDWRRKSVFYHFPISFSGSKVQSAEGYSRYRNLCETLDHNRLSGSIESYAYQFDSLHVFAWHRDIEPYGGPETYLRLLERAIEEYDEVVIDLPQNCPDVMMAFLKQYGKKQSFLVATPDPEQLNGLFVRSLLKEEPLSIWRSLPELIWIVNRNLDLKESEVTEFLKEQGQEDVRVCLVPEDYRGALSAKMTGNLLYDRNLSYRRAINRLMGVE